MSSGDSLAGRFWRGFEDGDRELILDAGLFDWFEEALFDDVVRAQGALQRLAALAGLLQPPGHAGRGPILDAARGNVLAHSGTVGCISLPSPPRSRNNPSPILSVSVSHGPRPVPQTFLDLHPQTRIY